MENLSSYFLPEQEFYLDDVRYLHKEKKSVTANYTLTCQDKVVTKDLDNDRLLVSVTRSLHFDPDDLFELSVTFCVVLAYSDSNKAKQDFEDIDLASEFIKNGQFALANIMVRLSLLIANITSSFGQPAIMTPPAITS